LKDRINGVLCGVCDWGCAWGWDRRVGQKGHTRALRVRPYSDLAKGPISDLKLDEQGSVGYTLKALSAGFWALLKAKDFKEGIVAVINEGGDTDTNGSVGGALLGAKFGFQAIPREYVEGLRKGSELAKRIEKLFAIMKPFQI